MSYVIYDENILDLDLFERCLPGRNSKHTNTLNESTILQTFENTGYPQNLALIYSSNGSSVIPFFQDPNNVTPHRQFFSNRLISFLNTIGQNMVFYFDIITSNLNDSTFATEVANIETYDVSNCTIRYSKGIMGNKYGNWILNSDSSNPDIKSTYFNTTIDNWSNILLRGINLQQLANNNPSSFTYSSSICKLKKNINISDISLNSTQKLNDNYFYVELGNNEIFDGSGYMIDVSYANLGLFETYNITSFTSAPLIKNLTVNSLIGITSNHSFYGNLTGGGGIVRKFQKYIKVNNCHSYGNILNVPNPSGSIGLGGGGIGGSGLGWAGKAFVENCTHSGSIGMNGGGICGSGLNGRSGNCIIYNCSSSGSIGMNAGGICGTGVCPYQGTCILQNCYSTGPIGINAGGICGAACGAQSGSGIIYINYCYSTGSIDSSGGGICGDLAGAGEGSCYIDHCYSTGHISRNAGGIYGTRAGLGSGSNAFIVADNCYSIGDISNNGGGIFGSRSAKNVSVLANNCYSAGFIDTNAGGIFGYDTGDSNGRAYVFNSYCNNGKVAGSINCPLYINSTDQSSNPDISCNLNIITGGISAQQANNLNLFMGNNKYYNLTQWTSESWAPGGTNATGNGELARLLTYTVNTATSALKIDPQLFVGLNETERNNVIHLFFDKFFNTPIRDESEIKPVTWFSDASNLGFTDTSGDLMYKIYNSVSQPLDLSTLDLSSGVYVNQLTIGTSYSLTLGNSTYLITRLTNNSYRFTDSIGRTSQTIYSGEKFNVNGYLITFGSIKVHKYLNGNNNTLTFITISKTPTLYVAKIKKTTDGDAFGLVWIKVDKAVYYKIYRGTVLVDTVSSKNKRISYSDKTDTTKKTKYRIVAYSNTNKILAETTIST